MGLNRRRGGALINPMLSKHVAAKTAEETAVMKERRKAKGERNLVVKPGAKGEPGGKKAKGNGEARDEK